MESGAGGTAVITMELQRGVCGDLAPWPGLPEAVSAAGVAETVAELLITARSTGVLVVHAVFSIRPDGRGTRLDMPLMSAARRDPDFLRQGTPSVELLPALGPETGDVVIERHHGVSPFGGTGLDALLRQQGVSTVVVTGVSLNIGVLGTVVEAVNLGYRAVVPTDAVVGVPSEYGHAVLANSLMPIARLATTAELIDEWTAAPVSP
ncbi:MAG: cysteine hydrolase family protein [Ilumatobacter sp.]|nr:MAG: cysteine hydrolase family protein [Ilumatobacter sp.]